MKSQLFLTILVINSVCWTFMFRDYLFATPNFQGSIIIQNTNNCRHFIGGNKYFNPMHNVGINSEHQKCADSLYSNTKMHTYDYVTDYGTIFEEWISSKKLRIIWRAYGNALPWLVNSAIDYWGYELSNTTNFKKLQSYFEQDEHKSTLWVINRFGSVCDKIIVSKQRAKMSVPLPSTIDPKYFVIDMCTVKEFHEYNDKWIEFKALKKFDSYPNIKQMYGVEYYNISDMYPETFGIDEIQDAIKSSPDNQPWLFKISSVNYAIGIYFKHNKSDALRFVNKEIRNIKLESKQTGFGFFNSPKLFGQKVLSSPWLINNQYIGRIRPYVLILSLNPLKVLVCKEASLGRSVKALLRSDTGQPIFEWESVIVNLHAQMPYREKYIKNDRRSMYVSWNLETFVISGIDENDTPEKISCRADKLQKNLYDTIKYHFAALHFDIMTRLNYSGNLYDETSNSMFVTEYCIDMGVDYELNTYVLETNTRCSSRQTIQEAQLDLDRGFYKISIAQEYLFRKWSLQKHSKYDLQMNKPDGIFDNWVSNFGDWIVLFDQKENETLDFETYLKHRNN